MPKFFALFLCESRILFPAQAGNSARWLLYEGGILMRNVMKHNKEEGWYRVLSLITLVASLVLMVAVSIEIIQGDNLHFSTAYMNLQLLICMVFLLDLVLRGSTVDHKGRFWLCHIPWLLLSIPWLNISQWCGWEGERSLEMLFATMPVWRSFLALYLLVHWLARGHRAHKLLWAYLLTVVLFTYLSALIFYDYEIAVNPHLKGFGNALWWAWMNVTTVGASIFPVTPVGKIFCVLLPMLGMAMFPIFTVYITTLYTKPKKMPKDL
jgi:voltage-gated potassium channel